MQTFNGEKGTNIVESEGLSFDDANAVSMAEAEGILTALASVFFPTDSATSAVKERAEMLAREQEARQQAEEANRFKEEFLATVSHEFAHPAHSSAGLGAHTAHQPTRRSWVELGELLAVVAM